MSILQENSARLRDTLTQAPQVRISLRPIAPPAALGLAGFAGSTFITASWIANWWGNDDSPTLFFPFVFFWGGLSQFIAGIYGIHARDILVSVVNTGKSLDTLPSSELELTIGTMWGAFWMSIGLLYLLVAVGSLPAHSIYAQFPELASWFVVLAVITWSCAFAACARDVILASTLFSLAIGTTIACCLFSPDAGRHAGIKVAAYFWMLSALLAWWRVTAYLVEEAYGADSRVTRFFPIFRTSFEERAGYVVSGVGEPGVKRGVPKMISERKVLSETEKDGNGASHHA